MGNLLRRLEVVLQDGVLERRVTDELAGVHVDHGQCLGAVDDDVAT